MGSTPQVLEKMVQRAAKYYPELKIVGTLSPPFRVLSSEEKVQIIEQVNQSGANIVLVSLGCPKQERWMSEHRGKINAVMVGIGGAFPVFAGLQARAPKYMQQYGMEWVYRLIQEPKRLFKRYFYTGILFGVLLLKQIILYRFKKL